MKKIITALFILVSISAFSQKINEVFKTMPNHILLGLSEGNRTMMLVDTGKVIIPSEMGNFEKLKQTNDYLKIKTSEIGTTQIKLLPQTDTTQVICVIKTVCGSACDSHIRFYTSDWTELDSDKFMPKISIDKFFDSSKKDSENYKFAVSLPDIYPISAEFENGSNALTLKLDLQNHLSDEQINEIKPFIKSETITLNWDNTSFR